MKNANNSFDVEEWIEIYRKICEKLGIDQQTDENHVKRVNSLLPENYTGNKQLNEIISLGRQKDFQCLVFGAAPILEDQFLKLIKNQFKFENVITIAADGVTKLFREYKLFPDIIVTDLDGIVEYRDKIHLWPSYFVIHIHGDNEQLLNKFWKYIPFERTIFTTQTEETGKIVNFGGFTDGDRAVSFAISLGFTSILLIGFEFDKLPGKYSKGDKWTEKKLNLKKKKLKIAEELIEILKIKYPDIVNYF